MAERKTHISTLLLERYLCGEVSESERAAVDKACLTDEVLRNRLGELSRSNKEIVTQYPPEVVATDVAQRSHRRSVAGRLASDDDQTLARGIPFRISFGSFAGALMLLFGLPVVVLHVNRSLLQQETTRIKGSTPSLTIYQADSSGYKKLENFATVVTGDRLQIGYQAAGKQYGVIFSVDGTGALTLHFPESGRENKNGCRLVQGKEQLLHASFELDSAPLFERFYLLASDDSIATSEVLETSREYFRTGGVHVALRIRHLPSGIQQTTFTLKKD